MQQEWPEDGTEEIESCTDLCKAPPSPSDASDLAQKLMTLMASPKEKNRWGHRGVPSLLSPLTSGGSDTHTDVDALDTPEVGAVESQLIILMASPTEKTRWHRRTVPSPLRWGSDTTDADSTTNCDAPEMAAVASQPIMLADSPRESFRRRATCPDLEVRGDASDRRSNPEESPGLQGACDAGVQAGSVWKMRVSEGDESFPCEKGAPLAGEASVPHTGALSLAWLNTPRNWLGAPPRTVRFIIL